MNVIHLPTVIVTKNTLILTDVQEIKFEFAAEDLGETCLSKEKIPQRVREGNRSIQ